MTFVVPRPSSCPDCKGGRIGLSMCETCAGSGTIFKVNERVFPDTREGYDAANELLNKVSWVMLDFGAGKSVEIPVQAGMPPVAWLITELPFWILSPDELCDK